MALSDVERTITNNVVERFLNLGQSTPRRHLVVKFKPHGSEAVHRLTKCNVLRQLESEELIPNAIAFHYCGNQAALNLAKTSVEVVVPALQHLYETTPDSVRLTASSVEANVKTFWPDVSPNHVWLGLYLCQEMGFLGGGWAWNQKETKAQALRVNENVINVASANDALAKYIRQGSTRLEQAYKREARAKFHQGIFDLVEGREDRAVTPMQRSELATRLGISKEDHDSIIRELMAEELIKQKTASEVISLTRKGIAELQKDVVLFKSQESAPMPAATESRKVFLVHGHAEVVKQTVARFLEKLNLEVVILHEQPNKGRTVIEKFEQHSDVGFAVVLMTPDDIGGPASDPSKNKTRARQNVILELGYFFSKLGRERVCAIYVDGVEIPSDIHGILYLPYDDAGAWRLILAKEIKAAGIEVDLNRAIA
jgi:predicted nucleotide-binding protein